MPRRPYILSGALIVAIVTLVFVVPFIHPISILLGRTTFSLKGLVGSAARSAQGFHITATAHPFYSRRLSLSLADMEWSAAIFRSAPPGDYGPSPIQHINQ